MLGAAKVVVPAIVVKSDVEASSAAEVVVAGVVASVAEVVVANVVVAVADVVAVSVAVVVANAVVAVGTVVGPRRPLTITKECDPSSLTTRCSTGSGTLPTCSARSSSDTGVASSTRIMASVVPAVLASISAGVVAAVVCPVVTVVESVVVVAMTTSSRKTAVRLSCNASSVVLATSRGVV